MRVLIADKFEQSGCDLLKKIGCEVLNQPGTKDAALVEAIKKQQPDVLIVRSTKVTEAMMDSGSLKLIVRAGAGYNTIDVAAASQRGIYVSNCPGKNSIAVAELAFALILALDRRVPDNVITLRKGEWKKDEFSKARGLFGRVLGLVGVGQIGQEMIPRAKSFGMPVVAWSRSLTPERAEELGIEYKSSPLEVAKAADVVSVHVAMTAETKQFLKAEFFAAMRPGGYFINTSRGEVVDQAALVDALQKKKIRAGLDVFANEPSASSGEFKDSIAALDNVYGTHHIGASTEQAQEAIAAETARIIAAFKETGKVPNVVNLAHHTPATHMLIARHRDRPGVLAHILNALRSADINVQEMENVIFEGAEAAVARINLDRPPPQELIDRLPGENVNIIQISMVKLA
jgi:D-3-phosphoglycerate dehydrogenase / 2-oxoglutarate reductase